MRISGGREIARPADSRTRTRRRANVGGAVPRRVVAVLAGAEGVERELLRAGHIGERPRLRRDVLERDPGGHEAAELRRRYDGRVAVQRLLAAELEVERLRGDGGLAEDQRGVAVEEGIEHQAQRGG